MYGRIKSYFGELVCLFHELVLVYITGGLEGRAWDACLDVKFKAEGTSTYTSRKKKTATRKKTSR